ncbi:hypothetical protein [Sphaerisporangium dianthi]|uniref:FCD domain-containing protein n=1 Tax=Sphaerisporangium dianthi TaxID=1436120 RepID=A0ABV9CAV2_9ACTN
MSTVPEAVAGRAEVLRDDARVLAECAERLRDIGDRMRAEGAAPEWLRDTLDSHIRACLTASGDVAEAASRLESYAARSREHL